MRTDLFFYQEKVLREKIKQELFIPLKQKLLGRLFVILLIISLIGLFFDLSKIINSEILAMSAIAFVFLSLVSVLLVIMYSFSDRLHKKEILKIKKRFEEERKNAFIEFHKNGYYGDWMFHYASISQRNWDNEKIKKFLYKIPYASMMIKPESRINEIIEYIKKEYTEKNRNILIALEEEYI